jgi:hypothetical protein
MRKEEVLSRIEDTIIIPEVNYGCASSKAYIGSGWSSLRLEATNPFLS